MYMCSHEDILDSRTLSIISEYNLCLQVLPIIFFVANKLLLAFYM